MNKLYVKDLIKKLLDCEMDSEVQFEIVEDIRFKEAPAEIVYWKEIYNPRALTVRFGRERGIDWYKNEEDE